MSQAEQRLRVGMGRLFQHGVDLAGLNDASVLHHQHPVSDGVHDIEVVGDENGLHAVGPGLSSAAPKWFPPWHPRRSWVHRRSALRIGGQGQGDVTLARPPLISCRYLSNAASGSGAHLSEQSGRKGALRMSSTGDAPRPSRLPADAHRRIEGRHWVLKHQAEPRPNGALAGVSAAAQGTGGPVSAAALGDVPLVGATLRWRAGDAFSRPLSPDGEDFPLQQFEVNPVHHLVFTKQTVRRSTFSSGCRAWAG